LCPPVGQPWNTTEQQKKGRSGKKARERGNIVFGREPNVIVMNMTNKSVQKKCLHM
jgi:hypothetical protein